MCSRFELGPSIGTGAGRGKGRQIVGSERKRKQELIGERWNQIWQGSGWGRQATGARWGGIKIIFKGANDDMMLCGWFKAPVSPTPP